MQKLSKMPDQEYKKLKHSRQYILSNEEIECPFEHQSLDLNDNYKLLYHEKLVFTEVALKEKRLILLGDIYDYLHPERSNREILNGLIELNLNDILSATTKMAGRFVAIVVDNLRIYLFHDTSAGRKVYYVVKNGATICSSSQHMLASLFGIKPTHDPSKLAYYQSKDFELNHLSNIGDSTYYDEIKQLLPNHFLNVNSFEIKRFWPLDMLPNITKEECIEECASMIEGFISAASQRYKLMMPISAGYDSRVLLAASRNIKERIFFYLNNSEDVKRSADSWVPKKMLADHNLEFHLLEISDNVDEKFKEIYYSNNHFANPKMIEVMYNYYLYHSEKLNLPGGTIPVIKSMYQSSVKKVTGKVLAKLHGYDKYSFAISVYDEWLKGLNGVCEKTLTNLYDLLYWEDRTPNWGTEVQLDKDIAQEEFVPFSSAYLVSRMLTYERNRRKQPYYNFHKDIIKYLWPELMVLPFNPSRINTIKQALIKLRIYKPVIKIKKFLLG